MNQFYIIFPPGLEIIGKNEIQEKFKKYFALEDLTIISEGIGGILISCSLTQGLALNMLLKCPSRILLRIDEFKCRDTPKLFNKIKKIQWNKYLLNPEVEIESAATESRLFDSRKISKTCNDAIIDFFKANPQKKKYLEMALNYRHQASKIYIRFDRDHCTVSIDTSGDHLHFRGRKSLTGLAPIRENMACALIYALLDKLEGRDWNLIDPMCGSGTFLIEALHLSHPENSRQFAYIKMPIYLEEKVKIDNFLVDNFTPFKSIKGFDINDEIVKLSQTNSANLIKIEQNDIFNTKLIINNDHGLNLVIVNPPYGLRVKTDELINSAYYAKLTLKIWHSFKPKRLGIIVPSEFQFNPISEFEIISKFKFKNGGIPVAFYVLESK